MPFPRYPNLRFFTTGLKLHQQKLKVQEDRKVVLIRQWPPLPPKKNQNRAIRGFWENAHFVRSNGWKTTFEWPKVVSEVSFPQVLGGYFGGVCFLEFFAPKVPSLVPPKWLKLGHFSHFRGTKGVLIFSQIFGLAILSQADELPVRVRWCLKAREWSRGSPIVFESMPEAPGDDPWRFQVIPGDPRWCQVIPGDSRWCQVNQCVAPSGQFP